MEGPRVISKWSGVPESIRALKGYGKKMDPAFEKGIHAMTEFLLEESLKVAPEKTGEMKASARTQYTGRGRFCRGRVSYNTRYAIYVHEDVDKFHAPPTYAKFLSRPAYEKRGQMNQKFWQEVNKVRL